MKDEHWAAIGKLLLFGIIVVISWWIISNGSLSKEIEKLQEKVSGYEDKIYEYEEQIKELKESVEFWKEAAGE